MDKSYSDAFTLEEGMCIYVALKQLVQCGEYALSHGKMSPDERAENRDLLKQARHTLLKVTRMMDGVSGGVFSQRMSVADDD